MQDIFFLPMMGPRGKRRWSPLVGQELRNITWIVQIHWVAVEKWGLPDFGGNKKKNKQRKKRLGKNKLTVWCKAVVSIQCVSKWDTTVLSGVWLKTCTCRRQLKYQSNDLHNKSSLKTVLSPLLFIIVLEALSRDFRVGVPWELFFADDLVIIATSLEECVERVKAWKEGLESKGLHVNMTKTKFMASGLGLDILQDSGKFPCAVCRTGVGRSSIRCSKCNLWVHYKKCSGLKTLSEDLSYECPRCRGVPGVRPVDGRPFKEVEVGDCVLEAVDRFCNLGDMLSAGGGCMAAATARCRCAWGKFRENLPLLTSKPVPFDLRGRLFSSNVRSSMLHGTETWPMTSAALHRLCRNNRVMIRWICGVKPSDNPSMDELHAKLGICNLAILVRERRLRWFGHVMRSNGEINRVRSRPVPGRKGPGRPKKTWEECVKQDLKVCGLSEAGTQDRLSWRSSVKNSRQEPTPSNGSLPQSMAAPPARRVLGMRTRSFNKTGFDLIDWLIDWKLTTRLWVKVLGAVLLNFAASSPVSFGVVINLYFYKEC